MGETNELLKRYTQEQNKIINKFFNKLAETTNKTGKIREGRKIKILNSWGAYKAEIVIEALNIYLKKEIAKSERGRGMNENYVMGIIRNKAGEDNAGRMVCGYAEDAGTNRKACITETAGNPREKDEGKRLQELFGKHRPTDKELDCDF